MGVSMFVLVDGNGTWFDWPLIGEFQLTSSLKGLLIAIIFFLIFAGWGVFRRMNKSWFYSSETKSATVEARKMIMLDHKFFAEKQSPDEQTQYRLDHLEKVTGISSMLQSDSVSKVFLRAMASRGDNAEKSLLVKDFLKKTNWVKGS